MHTATNRVAGVLCLMVGVVVGCRETAPGLSPHEADARVLAADEELGATRNEATKTDPLDKVIEDYLAGIDALDFSACSPEFTRAFRAHRDAWEKSIPFFSDFGELRGEMHDLFDQVRETHEEELKRIEDEIWSTWDAVEAAATPTAL